MQYSLLQVFANDGTIDAQELVMLEKLALRDGVVDEAERDVPSRIFSRVRQAAVSPDVWDEIVRFKAAYGIR